MQKQYTIKNKNTYDYSALKLILICMSVYFISYLGRKSYNSNMNEIMNFYGVEKDMAGLVGTFFFITYAVGQVFHGLMCKHYNPKIIVAVAMVVSSLCNIAVGLMPVGGFVFIKFIWFINGFSMASLWSVMILLLNSVLTEKHKKESLIAMAFPVSIGTFLTYGISALFSFLGKFKFTFFASAFLMLSITIVWLLFVDKWIYKCKLERAELEGDLQIKQEVSKESIKLEKVKIAKSFYVIFAVLAFFAIVDNFVKDGLSDWTPTILVDKYGLENWLSVLLTIALPCIACLGSLLALAIYKKIKDYIVLNGILFLASTAIMIILIACFNTGIWIITLLCFMVISCLMAAVNNVLTNIYPMQCEKGINAGMVAGLIDGFCYIGSALSSYGLGAIAKYASWQTVMFVLGGACALCVVICAVCLVVKFLNKGKIN